MYTNNYAQDQITTSLICLSHAHNSLLLDLKSYMNAGTELQIDHCRKTIFKVEAALSFLNTNVNDKSFEELAQLRSK